MITSLVAIITGHVALSKIKYSQGRLHGRGFAITGLLFGYLMLLLTIVAIGYIIRLNPSNPSGLNYAENQSGFPSPKERLDRAEMLVASDSRGQIAFGNSETAEAIAADLADSMKVVSEQAFTRSRKPVFELSGGNFLTYCELHEGSCVLIVHVPSYRKYEDDAKESLSQLAWALAQNQTSDYLDEGGRLAVALRGTLLYGDIMLGARSTVDSSKSKYRLGKSDDLLAFFPEETIAVPPSSESELDLFGSGSNNTIDPDPSGPNAEIASTINLSDGRSSSGDTKPVRPAKSRESRPVFENKISSTLLASIEAKGWNIQSLAFINDNRHLAAGRLDETVWVFDIESEETLYKSDRIDQLGQVVSLESSRGGQSLILGGYTGATVVMRVDPSGALADFETLYKHDREASCLAASPTYNFVLSGGRNGTLVWQPFDVRSENLRILQQLDKKVLAAHLPKEGSVALATDGRNLVQFSLQDGRVIAQHDLHRDTPQAAAFHPDGTHVVVSYGSEVFEYETEKATLRKSYKMPELGIQWSLALHPREPWLLTGGQGVVHVWDRETAQRLAVLDSGVGLYIQTLELTDDGNYLAMVPAAAGQSIKVFAFDD